MRTMRGIEPIIAVVILVAVTLVIAIGVIGWIMGWWGTMGATESLQIYPDSYINTTSKQLTLHVKNTGSAAAVIYKIEVVGLSTSGSIGTLAGATGITPSGTEVTVNPGGEGTITVGVTGAVPGTNYQVKIYTKAGNVYSATVQAKA